MGRSRESEGVACVTLQLIPLHGLSISKSRYSSIEGWCSGMLYRVIYIMCFETGGSGEAHLVGGRLIAAGFLGGPQFFFALFFLLVL